MRHIIVVITASLLFCLSSSCSSSKSCSQEKYYRIDYFSGGGFTGMEKGLTIECNGWLKNWERKLNPKKEILDSLILDSSTMQKIDKLMKDSEIFSYKMNNISNYTTTLILSNQEKKNIVSYNSSDVPIDLPKSIKAILSEIEKININK